MPQVDADIRKTFNTPPDANPWTWAYVQDGALETIVVGVASAQAAFNQVRTRFLAESFVNQTKSIRIVFDSLVDVEAIIIKSDDANPWSYEYRQAGHLETVVTGFATADAAVTAVRDRYLAEGGGIPAATSRVRVTFSPDEVGA